MRRCNELYGARHADTYARVMAKAKVCHRPVRFRITVPGPITIYRCGTHTRWYRRDKANSIEAAD